jgi:ADP-heptose:LPS heptosyltransferase
LLKERPTLRFFFTGAADERAYVEQALARNESVRNRAVNCAGLLTLGEFIALLSRSRLLLTNDSAPMHIASAVGTPVVALFGPESPQFYGPLGRAVVLYKPPSCSPCLNIYNAKLFICPYEARCMKQITIEDVLHAIKRVHVAAEPVAE